MRRGTTPIHTFNLPFKTEVINQVNITYSQGGKVVLEKNTEDCKLGESSIVVELSRVETLLFNENEFIKIQITYADAEGKVHESEVLRLEAGEVLNEREF